MLALNDHFGRSETLDGKRSPRLQAAIAIAVLSLLAASLSSLLDTFLS